MTAREPKSAEHMVDGRKKGNNYENAICRVLSVWLFPKLSPKTPMEHLPFRRQSTAIMPVVGHWNGSGDILHRPGLDSSWPFCVECKHVEGWTLDGMFSPKWPVWSWWDQATKQAARAERAPLLVCGRNRRPDYALLRQGDASCLGLLPNAILARKKAEMLAIVLLSDLVSVDPELLRNVSTPSSSPTPSSPRRTTTSASHTSPQRRPGRSGRSSSD